jgi:hypothetical protein
MVKFFAVALIFLTAATIALAYPSENDPKNIKYVLSKRHLYLMNLDRAMGAMVGDLGRDTLVVGKTKAQLQKALEYLKSPPDADAYMKGCYLESPWKDQDVLVVRDGPWLVLFSGENAIGLQLCKG